MHKMKKPITTGDSRRIQSANAKKNGGQIKKRSFPAKAQSAAEKNQKQGG